MIFAMRPASRRINELIATSAQVRAHDPLAMSAARRLFTGRISFHDEIYETMSGADAFVLATEWNEFKNIDFARVASQMRGNVVIDGRNIFDPVKVTEGGLDYYGVGRPMTIARIAAASHRH
jgi:UDPglucose 6-dehydrogenase